MNANSVFNFSHILFLHCWLGISNCVWVVKNSTATIFRNFLGTFGRHWANSSVCSDGCAAGDRLLNGWNVPRHDHRHHLQARELLSQARTLVDDLVQALINFYSHSEQRVKVFAEAVGDDVSHVNKKVVCHNSICSYYFYCPVSLVPYCMCGWCIVI